MYDIFITQILKQFSNSEELSINNIDLDPPSDIDIVRKIFFKDIILEKMQYSNLLSEKEENGISLLVEDKMGFY